MHGSARLTVHNRLLLCQRVAEGWAVAEAAEAFGISRQTASKWLRRFREEGLAGLRDRSTRPHRSPRRVPHSVVERIRRARLRHRAGPHVLSWMLGIARSTIYAVLRRLGLNRLRCLEPKPAVIRYEWPCPGDMVHLDTKKLGRIRGVGKRFGGSPHRNRGIGCNYVHVAIDDHTRLAYAEELPDESPETTVGFLKRALSFYGSHGIAVARILTDNGGPYVSRAFKAFCQDQGIRHRRTRPYTPRTNGKAESMVKFLINKWAYRRPYRSTAQRIRALGPIMEDYNHRRPHGGLAGATPISRVG